MSNATYSTCTKTDVDNVLVVGWANREAHGASHIAIAFVWETD